MQDSISLNFYIASNPDWQQNSQDGINSMTVPLAEAQGKPIRGHTTCAPHIVGRHMGHEPQ